MQLRTLFLVFLLLVGAAPVMAVEISLASTTSHANLVNPIGIQSRIVGDLVYITSGGAADSLLIFNVSNRSAPSYVTRYQNTTALNNPVGLFVYNDLAYVTAQSSDSFTIINVSNTASVRRVGYYQNVILDGAKDVAIGSNSIYYVVSSIADSLTAINVSNKHSPSYVGNYTNSVIMNTPSSVFVRADIAYVTAETSNAVVMLNVSNPRNIRYIANYTNSTAMNDPYNLFYDVRADRDILYVASINNNSLTILNVSDRHHPVRIGYYRDDNLLEGAIDVHVSDEGLAYVIAAFNLSMSIINVSDPTNPVSIGYYAPLPTNPYGIDVVGNYSYISSNAQSKMTILYTNFSSSPTPDQCSYTSGNWVVDDGSSCTTGYSVTGDIIFREGSSLSVSSGSNAVAHS